VTSRIAPERTRILNDAIVRAGTCVQYWMQASHRTEENPALVYAIERANAAYLPLIAYFGIFSSHPGTNRRHDAGVLLRVIFMIFGLLRAHMRFRLEVPSHA
jgi:deoxyribodipyrimidine photo-lyase